MIEYILLASMVAVVIVMLILRTNTAICFLALCAGSILLSSTGVNMGLIATSLTSGIDSSTNIIRILLLIVPLIVCIVMLRFNLKKAQLILAFIPAVATVLLGSILVVPELSARNEAALVNTETWRLLVQYQEAIVVFGLVSSLVLIFFTVKKPKEKTKKGKH